MDLLEKIQQRIDLLAKDIPKSNGTNISLENIDKRSEILRKITELKDSLEVLTAVATDHIQKINDLQNKDMLAMDQLLKRMKTGSNPSPTLATSTTSTLSVTPPQTSRQDTDDWAKVVKKKGRDKSSPPSSTESLVKAPVVQPKLEVDIIYKPVKFTEALSLNAIVVGDFNSVKQDGNLYYVEAASHFAIRLMGNLFHGNIGCIYTEEKNPEKIKDCKFGDECVKKDNCDYYHDPMKYPGSRNHRNYIASSWLYAPPDSRYKNKNKSRHFGSRERIDVDIVGLNEEEISRYCDQTMHDILCSLLLNQYHKKK